MCCCTLTIQNKKNAEIYFKTLANLKKIRIIQFAPNNDDHSLVILKTMKKKLSKKPNVKFLKSMRFEFYLTLLENCQFIIGNSSSAIMEAPYFNIPAINIGERQINRKVYKSLENLFIDLRSDNWIDLYINWELSLIKELGYESSLKINFDNNAKKGLIHNRNLLMENFIIPNRLKFPVFRNILENYFSS